MNISSTANTWLSQFKIDITSSTNKVFGNGRQQLEATVTVAGRKDGIISDEQLASISLVTLDDDGVYRELDGPLKASSVRDAAFEYYADTGTIPSNLELRGPVRRRRFYISSSRSGGSLDRLYARISKDDNTHYVTDAGSFNSSITVESITPLRYDEDDFEMSRGDEISTEALDLDIYYLKFKNPKLRIVKSTPHDVAYNHNPHYRYCFKTTVKRDYDKVASLLTHYAFKVGPERTFTVAGSTVTLNRRPGCMNIIRTITHQIYLQSLPKNEVKPSRWWIFDQYGNERKIEITQTDNGNRIGFKRFD